MLTARNRYDRIKAKYPPLKQEEINRLHARYIGGDTEARDIIVYSHLNLVLHMASRFTGKGLAKDDLVQEGLRALAEKAVPKYDPSLGHQFATYAFPWIRQYMRRGIDNASSRLPFRVPVHANEYQAVAKRIGFALEKRLGRKPTNEEVLNVLDETSSRGKQHANGKLRDWVLRDERIYSLDAPVRREELNTHHDTFHVPYEAFRDPDRALEEKEMRALCEQLMRSLSPRQFDIVCRRFGLDAPEETLETLGARYGLTRERIRQIELQALERLQRELRSVGSESHR